MAPQHVPVLLRETLDLLLAGRRGGLLVDATVGLGGHAEALLEAAPEARLVGIDRDPEALALAGERLARFGDRVRLVRGRYDRMQELGAVGDGEASGILADLGVSSLQLDTAERGFSFRFEAPLDMRMGGGGMSAREVVQSYPEAELERIFREYGEERQARRVARAVVRAREERPIETTGDLKRVVEAAKGAARSRRERRIDPSTRIFQALRIEVNRELEGLDRFLDVAVRSLEIEGRLVVLSYHSLEDRIVKRRFRVLSRGEVDPVTGQTLDETRLIEVLTKKPVRPSEEEVAANPRSRSARLRAAERRVPAGAEGDETPRKEP